MTDMDFISRVRDGLQVLRQQDPDGQQTFGASVHRYVLHPRVTEANLARFELRQSVKLPLDYRTFLSKLGNGGAGPYYGVFKLGEMDDNSGFKRWKPGSIVGAPSRPFSHGEQWNLPPSDLQRIRGAQDDEILATYWTPVDGALPICHAGCALRDWLVVSGPEAGHVWHDARAEFGGWSPRTNGGGAHQTFADWYLSWLDEALHATAPAAHKAARERQERLLAILKSIEAACPEMLLDTVSDLVRVWEFKVAVETLCDNLADEYESVCPKSAYDELITVAKLVNVEPKYWEHLKPSADTLADKG